MFRKLEDFAAEWAEECRLTQLALDSLTDASVPQAIAQDRRTLGGIAWHLVESIRYMNAMGLDFDAPPEGAPVPQSAAAIADAYLRISGALLEAVQTQWTDEDLKRTQTIMGEEWSHGASLRFVMMHQAHHRGQMTVLMRQAGLRPPELYGPTYEAWIDQGLVPLA